MPKPVFIVESVSKEASIVDQCNEELVTLTVDSIPLKVSPQHTQKDKTKVIFSFAPLPSSQEFIDNLLSFLDQDIYLAFDNNERGEYWSWMISEFIHTKTEGKNKAKRLRLTELTKDHIQKNLESPGDIQKDTALASQVKTIFDHFLCKHIERLIGTKTAIQGLPIDLTTITILSFLIDREHEIENLSPANKWEIIARLAAPKGDIIARLKTADGITEDGLIKNKEDVRTILFKLEKHQFSVKSNRHIPRTFDPPKPFNTLDLIQEAYHLLGISPETTLALAKELFYGAKINGRHQGLISFYSTLETDLPENFVASLRQSVVKIKGESALGPEQAPILSDQVPIIPLIPDFPPEDVERLIQKKEGAKLYALIRSRALASQMIPAGGEKIEVLFQGGDKCTFVAEANFIREKGYTEQYQGAVERKLLTPSHLVDLKEGLQLKAMQLIPRRTSGVVPEYYTLETLFSDMAELGFNMNDQVVTVLKNMLEKGYLEISEEGCLRPLENATKVTTVLDRAFPKMSGLNLIAYIVQTMDEAISGRKDLMWAIEQFNQTLHMHGRVLAKSKKTEAPEATPSSAPAPSAAADQTDATSAEEAQAPDQAGATAEAPEEPLVREDIEEQPPEQEEPQQEALEEQKGAESQTPQTCPKCGSKLNLKFGRFGPFYGCSAFPKCRFTKDAKDAKMKMEAEERTCPECSQAMQVKRGRFGLFWACTGYPQCHYTSPYVEKETLDMDCPLCSRGTIRTKRTKIGKRFYVCSDKECEFIAWTHPHAIPCPACGHPFLVEKKNTRGEISLKCPKSGCKHQQSPPEELAQEIANREGPKTSKSKKGIRTQPNKRKSKRRSKKH